MRGLEKPEQIIEDHLSELLRVKARAILREVLELEIKVFLKEYQSYRLSDGRQRVVRHGYHQDREIQTGIGPVSVKVPRSRYRQTENCQSKRSFLKKYCLDDGVQIDGIRSEKLDPITRF